MLFTAIPANANGCVEVVRDASMLIDVAQKQSGQEIIYPVIETSISYRMGSYDVSYLIPSCCFHDLMNVPDYELAGMGTAIIGNLCKHLGREIFNPALNASLQLKMAKFAKPIECPWPGMEDDRPVPLDLTKMPFEAAMFLDEQNQLKWRVDRLKLMNRIQAVWIPWLKTKLMLNA